MVSHVDWRTQALGHLLLLPHRRRGAGTRTPVLLASPCATILAPQVGFEHLVVFAVGSGLS